MLISMPGRKLKQSIKQLRNKSIHSIVVKFILINETNVEKKKANMKNVN